MFKLPDLGLGLRQLSRSAFVEILRHPRNLVVVARHDVLPVTVNHISNDRS